MRYNVTCIITHDNFSVWNFTFHSFVCKRERERERFIQNIKERNNNRWNLESAHWYKLPFASPIQLILDKINNNNQKLPENRMKIQSSSLSFSSSVLLLLFVLVASIATNTAAATAAGGSLRGTHHHHRHLDHASSCLSGGGGVCGYCSSSSSTNSNSDSNCFSGKTFFDNHNHNHN